jgi:acetyl-CoA acetyltransferase
MSQSAARKCFSEANMSPRDVDVIEVHDCFAPNEVSWILVSIIYKTESFAEFTPIL